MRPFLRNARPSSDVDADAPLSRDAGGPRRRPARCEFLGAPLDPLTMDETVALVVDAVESGASYEHTSVNAAKVCRIQEDELLRSALHRSPIVTADGQAVVWAARLFGARVPERVAGIDLFERLLDAAASRGFGVYLLGARPEVVSAVRARLNGQHPNLRIVGTRHGYWEPHEEATVVEEIAAAGADMLFVALDTPRKEIFLDRYRNELRTPFVMGVGGSFDVIAGIRKRAPVWLQKLGLEWLYRLAQEPRRLARRYIVGNARFLALVMRGLAARRARNRILFVGPATGERGGVAAVMAALAREPAPGYSVTVVASTGGSTAVQKLGTTALGLARMCAALASGRVGVVHIHASSYWSFRRKLLFWALARAFRRPVVWQIHCGRFEKYVRGAGRAERALLRRSLAGARRVVFLSTRTAERIADELGLANTLVVGHPATGVPRPPSGEPVVVALGMVTVDKGSFVLLDAFARVARRVPDAKLVLAGDGELLAARRRADELGLGDAVAFPGWVDDADKAALLERAAVVAHPSLVDALPMAVLEALAAGRAVVTSAVGAMPDVVRDGVDGFVVPPGDAEALADALIRVLRSPKLRASLAAGAAETAARFRPDVVAARFAEAYTPA
jgi:N-acetylglucosaminyldiphosphoundecaprenol N-acetyl-beta-D-mannosaminyltransferase